MPLSGLTSLRRSRTRRDSGSLLPAGGVLHRSRPRLAILPRSAALSLRCHLLSSPAAHSQVALEYAPPITTSILPPNPHASEPGLLFYLSGDNNLNADYAAGGNPVPNYSARR